MAVRKFEVRCAFVVPACLNEDDVMLLVERRLEKSGTPYRGQDAELWVDYLDIEEVKADG